MGCAPDVAASSAAAREYAAVDVQSMARDDGMSERAPKLALWELSVLSMIAEETAGALGELASWQVDDDDDEPPEMRPALLDALCAAERRLAEAEDKVALVRAAQEMPM